MSGLRDRLRTETAQQHEQLEADLNLTRPDLDLAGYISLLERFYGFYVPLEQQIAGALGLKRLNPFFKQRVKLGSLISDLTFFGHPFNELVRLPLAETPTIISLPEVLGAMYVTEGSTLGGQLIIKHVQRQFGVTASRGCAFFASYGEQVGPMWKTFCSYLEDHSSPEVDDIAVATAGEIFDGMHRWLCPVEAAAL